MSGIAYDDRWENKGFQGYLNLSDMLSVLTPHPQYRMLTLRATPHVSRKESQLNIFVVGNILKDYRCYPPRV
jgi:hypothetical protein